MKYYIASGYGDGVHADIVLFMVNDLGKIEIVDETLQGNNPSFLCRMGNYIYVASEQQENATVTAYQIQGNKLKRYSSLKFNGKGLCHLSVMGEYLFASCYSSGDLFILNADLSKVTRCYKGSKKSHIHWSVPWNSEILYATDLGENQILKFQKKSGALDFCQPSFEKISLKSNSGPRQILFSENNDLAIIINELDSSVSFGVGLNWYNNLCNVNATEKHMAVENYPGGGCLNAEGQLFLSNRGENTIALIEKDHKLVGEWDCHGNWPRYLLFSEPDMLFAACEKSNTINKFWWSGNELKFEESFTLYGASCIIEL